MITGSLCTRAEKQACICFYWWINLYLWYQWRNQRWWSSGICKFSVFKCFLNDNMKLVICFLASIISLIHSTDGIDAMKVINVGTSIGKVGIFGGKNDKLWCLTHIETLRYLDLYLFYPSHYCSWINLLFCHSFMLSVLVFGIWTIRGLKPILRTLARWPLIVGL